jgi:hypothetical protein
MEKLTLDQLEVENFAMQLSEEELSNLKGGTTPGCYLVGAALVAAGAAVWAAYVNSRPTSYTQTTTIYHTPHGDSTVVYVQYHY